MRNSQPAARICVIIQLQLLGWSFNKKDKGKHEYKENKARGQKCGAGGNEEVDEGKALS